MTLLDSFAESMGGVVLFRWAAIHSPFPAHWFNVLIEQMGLNMLTEFYLLRVDGSCVELVVLHSLPVTFYLTNHSEVV
ncbi:hypothetical protein ACT4MC_17485 [Vibrio furnissii]